MGLSFKMGKAGFVLLITVVNAVAAFVESGLNLSAPMVILVQTTLNGLVTFLATEESKVTS